MSLRAISLRSSILPRAPHLALLGLFSLAAGCGGSAASHGSPSGAGPSSTSGSSTTGGATTSSTATGSGGATAASTSANGSGGGTGSGGASAASTSASAASTSASAASTSASATSTSASVASTSASTSTASSGAGGSTSSGAIEFAPYFETWNWGDGSYPFTGLVDLKAKSGVNGVTIAFVLSNGGCTVTQDIQDNQSDVSAFMASGGLVKASFGGADGTYLDAACGSASALAGAIGTFVDQTGIKDLDFDVEQGPVMTTAANKKRGQALKQVQDQKGIKVAFTLPVDTTGLESNALDVVAQAASAGVTISHVNLMVMDYGSSQMGSMSAYAEQALTATQAQLVSTLGLSSADAWAMLGATPMIGQNDQSGEIFTLADAQTLLAFAQQKQIGLLSFWSIQRDRPGTDYNESSTVNTANYQFADVFKVVQ